jgi:hypothetical protein
MLMGQTLGVFNYELAVRLGLQESFEEVGGYGVQVNRAFGAGDTIVYIPLMVVSLIGLFRKKRWALMTTGAVGGISTYWSVTIGCMLVFLQGAPGYNLEPGAELWIFIAAYTLFGAWALLYLAFRGEKLLQ